MYILLKKTISALQLYLSTDEQSKKAKSSS